MHSSLWNDPLPCSDNSTFLLLEEETHIFGVTDQIFPFGYICLPNVPSLHIYSKKFRWTGNSLKYDPLLRTFYRLVTWRFPFGLDNLSNGHSVVLHKLNTIEIWIHLGTYRVHFVDEKHPIYRTTSFFLLWSAILFSLEKLDLSEFAW